MIIVCPYDRIETAATRHEPEAAISLLDKADEAPVIAGIPPGLHLKLAVSMYDPPNLGEDGYVAQLVKFTRGLSWKAPLLIHCRLGISRSPAAALIVQCALSPSREERLFAEELRDASPQADPNFSMIAAADGYLKRGGKLLEAVAGMADASSCFVGEVIELPFLPE